MSRFLLEIHSRDIQLKSATEAVSYLEDALIKEVGGKVMNTISTKDVIGLEMEGMESKEKLQNTLPGILAGTPGRKMRWGKYNVEWYRPIDSIVALYDGKVVDFAFGHIKAGVKEDESSVETQVVEIELKQEKQHYRKMEELIAKDLLKHEESDEYKFTIPVHCDAEKVKKGYEAVIQSKIDEIKSFIELDKLELDSLSQKEILKKLEEKLRNSVFFREPKTMTGWEFKEKLDSLLGQEIPSNLTNITKTSRLIEPQVVVAECFSYNKTLINILHSELKYPPDDTETSVQVSILRALGELCMCFRIKPIPIRAKYDPYGLKEIARAISSHPNGLTLLRKASEVFELTHKEKEGLWKFVRQHLHQKPMPEAIQEPYKRAFNILKKNGLIEEVAEKLFEIKKHRVKGTWAVDRHLFEKDEERELHKCILANQEDSETYNAEVARAISNFFDKVFIMHEDERIRKNRLALLAEYVNMIDSKDYSSVAQR